MKNENRVKAVKKINKYPITAEKEREIFYTNKSFLKKENVSNETLIEDCIKRKYKYINTHPRIKLWKELPKNILKIIRKKITNNTNPRVKEFPTLEINKSGIPDYMIWDKRNPENIFFVEVKTNNDTIRRTQIDWIMENNYLETYICYIEKSTWSNEEINKTIQVLNK